MRISVLGPIEIADGGRVIRLAGQRQRALLAALALDAGKVVAVERLVDVLWDASPPATARGKVQAHVSALRQAFGHCGKATGGLIQTRSPGYLLDLAGVDLDLAQFEMLTTEAQAAAAGDQWAAASQLLAGALALWRGAAFADVRSPWIRAAATAINERRALAIEAKAEADLLLGGWGTVVAEVSAAIIAYPLRERMRALLMLAQYQLGCRTDALNVYRDGRNLMVNELGLEPGSLLSDLHQRILRDDPSLGATALPLWPFSNSATRRALSLRPGTARPAAS